MGPFARNEPQASIRRRFKPSCYPHKLARLIAVLLETVARLAAEQVQPRRAGGAADHVVKLVRLAAVLAARRAEAGKERLGVDKPRLARSGIERELAIVL